MNQIGAFEAKTHFSEILRRVETGEEFHVTKHGRLVAVITPANDYQKDKAKHAFEQLIALKKHAPLGSIEEITEWKNQGRA